MFRSLFTTSLLLAACLAQAKTPTDIYEEAAKSTVVVQNLDGRGKAKSMGSGVVLPDGDVATNCHVVKDASQLRIRIRDKEYPAMLRHSDWDRDVCSLSVTGMDAPPVVIGNTKTLKVGAKVYAIGAPKGLELTLSDGLVSSLREVEGGRYIQTTAAISPGSSGGGLFDENGALVGLTTFYLAEGQSLNFAIPVEWIKELPKRSARNATTTQPITQWLNKAAELEKRKDWPAMIEHCHRWTKANSSSYMAWFGLGYAYDESGRSVKAIGAYHQALRINPEYAEAWSNLGIAYYKSGQPAKAIEAYQQALRINPEYSGAWNNLGNAYDKSGQPPKAIEAYQQALRIDPEYSGAWNNLCAAYIDVSQTTKAIEACRQALRIDPKYAAAWDNLGNAYDKSGQFAMAIDAYQQALRINPEDAIVWNNLGITYSNSGQSTKAIETYQQALRIDPEHALAWFNLGVDYAITGQRSKVLEVYKRLKALDPARAEKFFQKVLIR